ncbi:MAG: branched-chain amino acid aminotransferase [Lautropia sp.]|nr:branched-chain amino acid aminotransferase [Lautropia sp.]
MSWYSKTWTWLDGKWLEGNPPIMGPRTHAAWLGSSVFDGARAFEGVMPDIEAHTQRVNASAEKMGMRPVVASAEIAALAREGMKKFDPKVALYVKPMYWGEADGPGTIMPDPDSTRFCLCLFEAPMPDASGFSLGVSRFRRPTLETMPTDIKTGALYPNNARALADAQARGFGNAIVLDMLGNVAETATSNLFIVKDGVVVTPAPNGTFLNGITRQRTIRLLREEGRTVLEQRVTLEEVLAADEVFCTGNYGKVQPVTRVEERRCAIGPVYRKARELYWAFAHDRR